MEPELQLTSHAYARQITDDTEAVQMLQRTSQVGEFYILGPPV